jgi:hypothetical protein
MVLTMGLIIFTILDYRHELASASVLDSVTVQD